MLAHERAGRDAPDFLPKLQKELIDVVGRYVEIRDDMIRVNLGKNSARPAIPRCSRSTSRSTAPSGARSPGIAGRPSIGGAAKA